MLDFIRDAAIFAIPFVLLLTVVVAIHELGHFLVAKAFNVAIEQFAIGFGKPILKWTDKAGVEWRIGWIPLGGFVRFAGDANEASVPDSDDLSSMREQIEAKLGKEAVARFYHFKPVWQRALIAVAGPVANFILAVAIFFAIFSFAEIGRTRPLVGEVKAGSPAAAAGFQKGDLITKANGRTIRDFSELVMFVSLRGGDKIDFDVTRANEPISLTATLQRVMERDPHTGAKIKHGQLGIASDPNATYGYKAKNPIEALDEAVRQVHMRLDMTLTYIGRIFRGRENGDQLSGVIGMASATGSVTKDAIAQTSSVGGFAQSFFFSMAQITATISIGLGFVNLLPIPMLDGGHLAFYAYEAIARRPMAARVQAASFKVGLALVLGLMLFATWNDLQRLEAFRFLGELSLERPLFPDGQVHDAQ